MICFVSKGQAGVFQFAFSEITVPENTFGPIAVPVENVGDPAAATLR